jgi:hypothetical protein
MIMRNTPPIDAAIAAIVVEEIPPLEGSAVVADVNIGDVGNVEELVDDVPVLVAVADGVCGNFC